MEWRGPTQTIIVCVACRKRARSVLMSPADLRVWVWCARVAVAVAVVVAAAGALLPLDAERLHASVGGYAVMNCHLDFPFGNEIPYHLQWDKDVSRTQCTVS